MEDTEHDAGSLFGLATIAYHSGSHRQALQLLDEAIAKAPGDDSAQRANLLLQKAGWLRESGDPEEAARALDDTARELDRLPRAGHKREWSLLRMEQGVTAKERGDFKAAEAFLAEAETLSREVGARDLLTDVFANQASLYLDQGRLSSAQDVLLAALELDQRLGYKREESNDLNMLGLVYERLGDAGTSRAYFTRAFEVADQNGFVREALDARANLANLMDDAGDHEGAAEIYKEIGQARAEGGDESGVACSVANQGIAAFRSGNLEQAATLLTRSHGLHLAAGNQLHSVQDQLHLSGVESQRGNLDKALTYAEQALAAAREFGLVELLWGAEYTVASCRVALAKQSNGGSGWTEALEEALAGYSRAADVVELLRSKVDRPEERESLLTGKEQIYDAAIALCLALKRGKDAFRFCERARMRSFLEALGSSRLRELERDDPAAERRGQLVARLLSPLTPAGEKPGLMDELRTLRAEITARRPALAALTEAELPTVDDIRAAIPADTCLLEYYQVSNGIVLFLLDQDGLKDWYALSSDTPLETVVQRFRDEIEGGDAELATGNLLFQGLLAPVMPRLTATANLIVVPHRSLHYVPFSALWYEPAGKDAPPRKYLRNRFYLTTIPSASYLPYLARTAELDREYGQAVVLGNPTGDLAGAGVEAQRVAAKLGVTAQLGTDATRDALLAVTAPRVLHVAGHGSYNTEDPLLSGLELADGVVTVEDLLTSGPAPGLLVLSGCVTGISGRKPGDELVGLAQAALRSGTRSVVATLWETFDESSTIFFEHFYEALTQGARVSEAIAWGREALSADPEGYDQPVDWAPFLLIGDPDLHLVRPDQVPMSDFDRGAELLKQGDIQGAMAAFQLAVDCGDPKAEARSAYALGMLLNEQGAPERALAAWQLAADSGNPQVAPLAMWGLGGLFEDRGDIEGARAAYQRAIDSSHTDAAPRASNNLGVLLMRQGDTEGARVAFQRAIDSSHTEAAPQAATNLGNLLARQGDREGARAAYQLAIDSAHAEYAPLAAFFLGNLLAAQGDVPGARAAYQLAIDSGHADAAPEAAGGLGVLLEEQGDVPGARAAYQLAIDSGHADYAPRAAGRLGNLLAAHGDVPGARAAYQLAIDSAHAGYAPLAAFFLGNLLAAQGDVPGARAAYQLAIDSGHADAAPEAAGGLGVLLEEQGDVPGARAAYQLAIDSGHANAAPPAAFNLAVLLEEQGDVPGARAAYQLAVDSGHAGYAPEAAGRLGALLQQEGDVPGARAAYQLAVDSGDADVAPRAAARLGMLLQRRGMSPGARAAYQLAIDSGHADIAPSAAFRLGVLLHQEGDVPGARAAYQLAIDSGHADYAPRAAFFLGNLLAAQGDIPGARGAYQLAVDSGHADAAPLAAINLAGLLREQGDAPSARAAYQLAIDSGHADYAPKAAFFLGNLLAAQGDILGARGAYQLAVDSGHGDVADDAARCLGALYYPETT